MQTANKSWREQHRAVAVHRGIADIGCYRVFAVRGLNLLEALSDHIERFVPGDALPALLRAVDGIFEPVLVEMKILQGDRFRTDISAAEGIVFVARDVESTVGAVTDFNATDRFADTAVAIVNRIRVAGFHLLKK